MSFDQSTNTLPPLALLVVPALLPVRRHQGGGAFGADDMGPDRYAYLDNRGPV